MKPFLFTSPVWVTLLFVIFGIPDPALRWLESQPQSVAAVLTAAGLVLKWGSIVISAFFAFLFAAYAAMNAYFGSKSDWGTLMDEVGVPKERQAEAIACFKEGKSQDSKVLFYGILAPLVVPIALIFTKWSAERLPTLFWQWDNNINPNGDNGPWNEVPKTYFHNGDRRVVTEHHYQSENPDDISAFERCYWAEGHHPRSAWARYIWLGWRNRAKAMYQSMGKPVDLTIVDEFWGNPNQNRSIEGTHVRTNNGLWQMRRTKKMVIKYWPGKTLNMCLVQNFGYKVNNAHAEQKVLAMPVYIMSAIKRWEGE